MTKRKHPKDVPAETPILPVADPVSDDTVAQPDESDQSETDESDMEGSTPFST